MQKILIHPGMNKTATHFLHSIIFPEIKGIQTIIRDQLLRDCYTYPTEDLRSQLFAGLDNSKPLMISDGTIIMYDSLTGISNIAEMFPDANIMVTLRNQWDLLISNYLHTVDKGLTFLPFETFMNEQSNDLVLKFIYSLQAIKMLMEKFDGRVEVFFYEEYRYSMEPIVQHILQTLDIDQTLSEMSFGDSIDFRNESVVGLSKIMLMFNLAYYVFNCRLLPPKVRNAIELRKVWIRQKLRGSRRLAVRKERKIIEFKNFITLHYGESFEQTNHELEKILDRSLPPEYFPSQSRKIGSPKG
jgi:hypothetical protein